MRALPLYNFPAFEAACKDLRAKGWTVWSPAEHDLEGGFDPATTDMADFNLADALVWDFQKIMESSYLIVLPGWEKSTGTMWEATVAYATGKPVLQYPELTPVDLPDVVTNPVQVRTAEEAAVRVLKSREAAADTYAHMRGVDGPGAWSRLSALEQMRQDSAAPREEYRKVLEGEIRVVDAVTGGAKGQKDAQLSPLDPQALLRVAEVAGYGAKKYDRVNYLKGFAWHLSFDAMQRHLLGFWGGEDIDPESGLPHLAHAAWHCLALLAFMEKGLGTDDRYTSLH
jgi:hypothetical protein